MIAVSKETVYHGGGRRWLTRKSAEKAEALKIVRKLICDCEEPDHDYTGSSGYPGNTCEYHAMESEHIPALKQFVIQATERFTKEWDEQELAELIIDQIKSYEQETTEAH